VRKTRDHLATKKYASLGLALPGTLEVWQDELERLTALIFSRTGAAAEVLT
jgi:hypothetical protein